MMHVDIYVCQCTLEAIHFSQLQELTKLHVLMFGKVIFALSSYLLNFRYVTDFAFSAGYDMI